MTIQQSIPAPSDAPATEAAARVTPIDTPDPDYTDLAYLEREHNLIVIAESSNDGLGAAHLDSGTEAEGTSGYEPAPPAR